MIFFGYRRREIIEAQKKKEEERRAAGGIAAPADAADKLEGVVTKAFDAWQKTMKELGLTLADITLLEIERTEEDLIAGVRRFPKKWKRKKGFVIGDAAQKELNELIFRAFDYISAVISECDKTADTRIKILLGRCETSIANEFEELIFEWAG